jgi:hypothetical protein
VFADWDFVFGVESVVALLPVLVAGVGEVGADQGEGDAG